MPDGDSVLCNTGKAGVGANWGNTLPAACQSRQPSRQTSESAATRPSASQVRMTSGAAGPNCPPDAGRTYQTDCPPSAIGSGLGAAEAVGASKEAGRGSAGDSGTMPAADAAVGAASALLPATACAACDSAFVLGRVLFSGICIFVPQ